MHPKTLYAAIGLAVLLAAFGSTPAAAQAPAPMKLTVNVAGRSQTLRGNGQCRHEPRASLYGKNAALWSVDYPANQAAPGVSLSYWRFAAGGAGDQFTLTVSSGRTQHTISNAAGQRRAGSGRVSYRAMPLGGRFEIAGTAQDGAALHVIIECARFGAIYAEGG